MTCKTLRLINLREDFDYKALRKKFEQDIASWNRKFSEKEYVEIVFYSPGHLRYFCEQMKHQVDFQLSQLIKYTAPFDIFGLFAPNLEDSEIGMLRRDFPTLTCISALAYKYNHTTPSYIIEFMSREDTEGAVRSLPKLRPVDFTYRSTPCKAVSWSLPMQEGSGGLVITGVKPELICRVIGMRFLSHFDVWTVLYDDDLESKKRLLDDSFSETEGYYSSVVADAHKFVIGSCFRALHAERLKLYRRFTECVSYDITKRLMPLAQ